MHNSLQSFTVLVCGVTIPHWDAQSQYTFHGPWIERFQDSWWDPEFPQLSQMVQSLPGFLNLCLNVCSPSQVLWDVYTEVLEAAHPLHRCPTDHKRSVGPLLFLPEVYNQLFSFAHVQRETVVLLRLESLPGQENMIILLQFYSLCTGYLLSSVSVTKYDYLPIRP